MGDIGAEAGLDLGEGIVVVAEDRGLDAIGMGRQEALVEVWQFIAGPGEILQLVGGEGDSRRQDDCKRGKPGAGCLCSDRFRASDRFQPSN
nr:hypothetical protein [Mesorhizobium sp. L2C085B000]